MVKDLSLAKINSVDHLYFFLIKYKKVMEINI